MKHRILIAALVLAGCGQEPEKKGRQMTAEEVADELSEMKIQPGQWEATNEILSAAAPGMPEGMLKQMIGEKTTVQNCITPEQAAKPSANFLAAQENSNCTYQDWSMDGGRMTGTMTCEGGEMPGKMVMTMAGKYGSSSYDMNMDMNTTGLPNNMSMTIKARTTGRRVGDCA
ncbi:MAG TPA: DUF3617 domain-containing protein [Allosphingosinicella sp.]|jgi:hypothetical protein